MVLCRPTGASLRGKFHVKLKYILLNPERNDMLLYIDIFCRLYSYIYGRDTYYLILSLFTIAFK